MSKSGDMLIKEKDNFNNIQFSINNPFLKLDLIHFKHDY